MAAVSLSACLSPRPQSRMQTHADATVSGKNTFCDHQGAPAQRSCRLHDYRQLKTKNTTHPAAQVTGVTSSSMLVETCGVDSGHLREHSATIYSENCPNVLKITRRWCLTVMLWRKGGTQKRKSLLLLSCSPLCPSGPGAGTGY